MLHVALRLITRVVLQVGATGKAITNVGLVGIGGTVVALLGLYLCILHSKWVNYGALVLGAAQ